MKKIFIYILIVLAVVAAFIYGIDKENARRDYLAGKKAVGCLFDGNCEYYNNKLI